MIADRARFRAAKKLQKVVGYRVPEFAFNGAFLEAVCACADYQRLDHRLKEQLINFFRDFLDCSCKQCPLCGCPERKFAKTILELRMTGLNHRQISEFLLDEYGIDLFPADILSFLEESVYSLEAVRDIARIDKNEDMVELSTKAILDIEK
ncbi:RNA helicase [Methanoplanus sp. FWC-SCC4]|uniref:RNA helicase n=1 Tax=Methanochimaera problematica TaxID=2609417 RepID=A0AA97I2L1_9EURY|nr:DUF5814 domain-containing protein [Methanoplanus sp. FWC-SCC4]WOF16395.1 RNA helicase [Methanoplanus sp. FWC-SCC4]